MRTCNTCAQSLPMSCFTKDCKGKEGYRNKCKECARRYQAKRRYGADNSHLLTPNCECCGVELKAGSKGGNRRVIDHCHTTGAIRGVLCNECNLMLGYAHDGIDRLGMGAAYLRKHLSK